jgi:hypothetical protein
MPRGDLGNNAQLSIMKWSRTLAPNLVTTIMASANAICAGAMRSAPDPAITPPAELVKRQSSGDLTNNPSFIGYYSAISSCQFPLISPRNLNLSRLTCSKIHHNSAPRPKPGQHPPCLPCAATHRQHAHLTWRVPRSRTSLQGLEDH